MPPRLFNKAPFSPAVPRSSAYVPLLLSYSSFSPSPCSPPLLFSSSSLLLSSSSSTQVFSRYSKAPTLFACFFRLFWCFYDRPPLLVRGIVIWAHNPTETCPSVFGCLRLLRPLRKNNGFPMERSGRGCPTPNILGPSGLRGANVCLFAFKVCRSNCTLCLRSRFRFEISLVARFTCAGP